MGINSRNKAIITTLGLIAGIVFGIVCSVQETSAIIDSPINSALEEAPKTSSEEVFVDKVFTFLAPNDTQQFNDLFLYEDLNYYVLLEIVTPHSCEINVSVIDPDLDVYEIFKSEVIISQEDEWFEVPFGTAIAGNYTFIFSVVTVFNLNVYVKISYDRELKCLYDVISPDSIQKLELYQVNKFGTTANIWNSIRLKLFTEPYVRFLRSQGLVDTPPAPVRYRDSTGSYIKAPPPNFDDFTIIEYLFAKDIGVSEIAIAIGLCKMDGSQKVKSKAILLVSNWLAQKYKKAFEKAGMSYNSQKLRSFLKSHFIGEELYW